MHLRFVLIHKVYSIGNPTNRITEYSLLNNMKKRTICL